MTTPPSRSTSTSADRIQVYDPRGLGYGVLGTEITVQGRDITLGKHNAPPLLHTGVVESVRLNKNRIVLVMSLQIGRRPIRQPRVVEIEL